MREPRPGIFVPAGNWALGSNAENQNAILTEDSLVLLTEAGQELEIEH